MTEHRAPDLPQLPELAEYEFVRELGRGGTAVVYLARERELGREVAVKLMRPSLVGDEESVKRLVREARTVGKLQHPNIVMLLGTRRLPDGGLALILQYVPGRSLKDRIRADGPLPFADCERILRDVAGALAFAHRSRIVHRDLKPENVYLDESLGVAKLADFGIARAWDSDSGLTLPGTAIGTPAYMSPEQVDGHDLDGRSDLYSLGLLGYEMLTGKPPWEGESLYGVIYNQKHEELPALEVVRPGVPENLRAAIAGAVRKDPGDRWRNAHAFLAALAGQVGVPGGAEAPARGGADTGAGVQVLLPRPGAAVGQGGPRGVRGGSGGRGSGRTRTAGLAVVALVLLVASGLAMASPDDGVRDFLGTMNPWNSGAERVWDDRQWLRDDPPGRDVAREGAPDGAPDGGPRAGPEVGPEVGSRDGPEGSTGPGGSDPASLLVISDSGDGRGATDPEQASTDVPEIAPGPSTSGAVALPVRAALAVGGTHACSLRSNGTLTCWGGNESGQLGDGSRSRRVTPSNDVQGGPFALAAAGVLHMCALLSDGTVHCWGANDRGQSGGEAGAALIAPRAVPGAPSFASLSVGLSHSCGRTREGVVHCWGANGSGQLGDGTTTDRGTPTPVAGTRSFQSIAAGWQHTCGLDASGRAYCWGNGGDGRLGAGGVGGSSRPRAVLGGHRFLRLAAGNAHTCGITTNHRILCWGSNAYGQLGTGSGDRALTPEAIGLDEPFSDLAAGGVHTCGVAAGGAALCWGRNHHGQLGDGTTEDRPTPTPVAGGARFSELQSLGSHNCGRTPGGDTFCWGYNVEGQLGDGTRQNRLTPVPIAGARP